ncbi:MULTISPECIES: glucose-1-phosphate cytidylyltransferase [unclassified Chamaesiphon]|uniref:glucose-1-phosphate cytidylyltransferase n=1 Tax=unclassified Chamaesiphon TaxID=2620921 RepID=UPI00286AFAE6|nr:MULTISPECIES: glucose-1-phosphate cytidylyltransferase [unclassified Chamaesiphon]
MKVVLLAGGLGTRLTEETEIRPKPMVEIGGRPILWHIMKHYAHYGFNEFLVALGYKGEYIKRYFLDYYTLNGSMTLDLATGLVQPQLKECEDWKLHLLDTGVQTNTGGRLKRLEPYLSDGTFLITYGDGVSNIDLQQLLAFHKSHGKWVTVSAVRPPARFGGLVIEGDLVANFTEKPQAGEGWINGGFLVMEPQVFKYLTNDSAGLEIELLEQLATDGQLAAYRHYDFWQCMDTLRDKYNLENYWQSGNPPWKVWE